jgi:imidazole glycerol-phosphate synthase subunit HisH
VLNSPAVSGPPFVIVDYGLGNLGSVANMLRKTGVRPVISSSPDDIQAAQALILPGVGSFDVGMKNLAERGLVDVLRKRVLEQQVPILGICLGMQLLTQGSEEGVLPGLGWVDAETRKFSFQDSARPLPLPHMGWNDTLSSDPVLFHDLSGGDARFYYVHSYHVVTRDPSDTAASCEYGLPFTAAIRRKNIFGTQFHPEKSHQYGLRLLRNFVEAVRG